MPNEAEWLFMLYLSGDNNLSSEMIWSLKEIQDQKLPDGVEITILYDALSPYVPTYVFDLSGKSKKGPPGSHKMESRSIRLPLAPSGGVVDSKVYEWVEDSSDPSTLRKFIEWSVRERLSKRRMLILSGHGSGAVGDFLPDNHGSNGSLTIPALQGALDKVQTELRRSDHLGADAKLIDVLGMDSCLMSMAEVCYEVRDAVEYLVGSEGFVQNAGWPYGYMLNCLRTRPIEKANPELMAQRLVEDYIAYYREYLPAEVSVDIAACELAKLGRPNEPADSPTLRRAVSTLASLFNEQLQLCRPDTAPNTKQALVRDMIILAHWRAQSYKFEQYTDLWDFCEQFFKSSTDDRLEGIKEACRSVQHAIDGCVGRNNNRKKGRQNYEGIEFQHSYGLSVYFPWSCAAFSDATRDVYQELEFAHDTGWGDFLELYLDRTRREPRESKGRSKTLFGLDSEEAEQKAAEYDGIPPFAGSGVRNAPFSGRNAPFSGRNAPFSGRILDLFLALNGMKNPPQSVFPLSVRQSRSAGKHKGRPNAKKKAKKAAK